MSSGGWASSPAGYRHECGRDRCPEPRIAHRVGAVVRLEGIVDQADRQRPDTLRRGALLRYKRMAGLSSVEFGLVVSLGRRPPMSVVRLAAAVGMDKGQISRALAELVSRKLVAKAVNPRDNREVLVCLTRAGSVAHDAVLEGALERNQHLLEKLSEAEVAMLLGYIDGLTDTAARMLAAEKDLG